MRESFQRNRVVAAVLAAAARADRALDATYAHLRGYLPAAGLPYEVFDQAVLLFILGSIGYVFTDPTPATLVALQAPLHFYTEQTWGLLITGLALVGIICSYSRRYVSLGLLIVMGTAAFWAGSLFFGFVLADAGARALMSAVIYGTIASRMRRVQKQHGAQCNVRELVSEAACRFRKQFGGHR